MLDLCFQLLALESRLFNEIGDRSNHLKPLLERASPEGWEEKYVDPLAPVLPDARDWTQRVPQYSVVKQKCKGEKPGPGTHNRLHKAVASGDKKVGTKTLILWKTMPKSINKLFFLWTPCYEREILELR